MRPAMLAKVEGCVAAQGVSPQRGKTHEVHVARRAHERSIRRRGRLLITEAPTLANLLLRLLNPPLLLLLITRPFVTVDAASCDAAAEGREQELSPGCR